MLMRVCTTCCAVENSNTMDRRLQRRVVAIAVLLVLLPPLPPALSAPSLPLPGAGAAIKYFISKIQTGKIVKSLFKMFLQHEAKKILKNFGELLEAKIKSGQHQEEKSADSASLLMFNFNLSVGWPSPQNVTGVLDITSELVWTQCAPCTQCLAPPAPTFQPNRSETFESIPCGSDKCQQNIPGQTCGRIHSSDPCDYVALYDDDTNTTGHLANDTFTFGDTPVPGLLFGCSSAARGNFSGASGVFGFNRGALSLVSQLQLSWFSYLWASDDSSGNGSQIQFGGGAAPPTTQNSRSTRFLTSSVYPDMYFVRLTGIRVDGEDLGDIPPCTFDFQPDGSGGVLLSTTVPVTYLEQAAYDVVRKAIATKITSAQPVNGSGSAVGLDLCYKTESLKNVTVPNLALVFGGVDAVMNLHRYNYFFNDSDSGLDCLTILPSLGGSVLGSLVQKGTTMTYDIAGQQLIFEKAAASLAHSMASLTLMLPYYLAVWAMLF